MQGRSTIQIGRYYPQRRPAASINPVLENHPSNATLQVLPTCQDSGLPIHERIAEYGWGFLSQRWSLGSWRWTLADLSPYRNGKTHLIKEINDRIPVFSTSYDITPHIPADRSGKQASGRRNRMPVHTRGRLLMTTATLIGIAICSLRRMLYGIYREHDMGIVAAAVAVTEIPEVESASFVLGGHVKLVGQPPPSWVWILLGTNLRTFAICTEFTAVRLDCCLAVSDIEVTSLYAKCRSMPW
ncbi:uncharacterized protein CLUP02_00907 [Colletotrichum lupini]|uniref:Uncharacterized protein n=1 Tax=Colletotrichum lupini TaxID=145971 RepID=A0A9Q8W8N7_9PEZI|nr:uncharacterized protein CLUP02_00907 [Colletotrichum lupini]UQC74259.1 hypothetical protein CLUP02_00907 [Colletotrichum lupini]